MEQHADSFSEALARISQAPDVVSLRARAMDALSLFGIKKAYFVAPLTGDPRVGRIVTNIGFPEVWERRYRAGLALLDPLPDVALKRISAIFWPDDLEDEPLTPGQQRYIDLARRYGGMARGIGAACFGPHGRSGFLGADWPHDRDPEQMEIQQVKSVGQNSFERYCNLVRPQDEVQSLSNRELEVLHWIGQGKSNPVIAELLEISASSVDAYVRRIFAKLNVTDRTTASVKAFSLGLIVSSDYQRFMRDVSSRA